MKQTEFKENNIPTIHIGKHRNPIWPQGLVGSITHNASKAACVLASSVTTEHIGFDIEAVLTKDTASDIVSQVLQDKELNLLLEHGVPFNLASTIIFSAKESIFKALYPKVLNYFGFECACLIAADLQHNKLTFTLTDDLRLQADIGAVIECHFGRFENSIFTITC